jgi:hypothetical protein
MKVLCQLWVRGKAQEPKGYSLHLTKTDRDDYIDTYNLFNHCYSIEIKDTPLGEPYLVDLDWDSVELSKLESSKGTGISYPGIPPKKCEE